MADPEFNLAVCAIVKNEGRYLAEWIAYHRVIGVQHFFMYDNDSNDGSSEWLAKLAQKGILTHVRFPGSNAPQLQAYKDALERFGSRAEWLAVIDADEFLVPNQHDDIKDLLKEYPQASGLAVNWKIFGSSGHPSYEAKPVMERFQMAAKAHHGVNRHVKSIVKPARVKEMGVHIAQYKEGQCVNELQEAVTKPLPERVTYTRIQMNHYFCKSREEWLIKRARGRATVAEGDPQKIRDDQQFFAHDINEEKDTAILRFLEATKKEMDVLQGLVT